MQKRRVAVFDVDGTIFRSSLLIELVEELINGGAFPASARKIYSAAHKKWLDRKGSYEDYIRAVINAFDLNVRGISEKELLSAIRRVMKAQRDQVYRYTRGLIGDLKKRGYFILAISHSPKYILDEFCGNYGFDKVYGRILELKDGKFTGKTFYTELIMDKAKILSRAVKKENLTMKNSVGVGDTESDIPFLKMVEKPVCFNPNQKLYGEALRRKWSVVVERKDVIYFILGGRALKTTL